MEPKQTKILIPLAAALTFLLGFITSRTLDNKTHPRVEAGRIATKPSMSPSPEAGQQAAAVRPSPVGSPPEGTSIEGRPPPETTSSMAAGKAAPAPSLLPTEPPSSPSPQLSWSSPSPGVLASPSPWPVPSPSPDALSDQPSAALSPSPRGDTDAQIQNSIQILQTQLSQINQQLDQALKGQELEIIQQNAAFNDALTSTREQIQLQQQVVAQAVRNIQMTTTDAESEQMINLQNQYLAERARLEGIVQQYGAIQNQRAALQQSQQQARANMTAQAQGQRAAIQERLAELQSASAIKG